MTRPHVLSHMCFAGAVLAASPAVAASGADRVTLAGATAAIAAVTPQVEKLRGLEFARPVPVEVIGDAQAREYVLLRLEEHGVHEQIAVSERAYRLLGLIDRDDEVISLFLDALEEQAGGFYDPATERFYLLDDAPAAVVEVLAAHELTHALDDQHFDIEAQIEAVIDDDDRAFAAAALHEGSATLLMSAFAAGEALHGRLDLGALADYEAEAGQGQALEALPPVLLRQLVGPYLLGAAFLARGDARSVMLEGFPVADVNRAFADPPVSSEQILHPERYWDLRDDPRAIDLAGVGALLRPRHRREGAGVLGELTLALLTDATTATDATDLLLTGGAAWTNSAADGWDGDRWELWSDGDSSVVLLLTVWDTEEDAREFARAVRDTGPAVRQAGDRVAIVAGAPGKRVSRLLGAMLDPSRVAPGMVK